MRHDRSVLQVMAKRCDQCLYSKNKIVSTARRDQIIAECDESEQHFVCHKATEAGCDVMCRGHWDRTKDMTLRNRLAQYLGVIRFVTIESLEARVVSRRARRAAARP